LRPSRVEEVDALLDALEGLDDVALEADEDVHGVLVRASADLLGVGFRLAQDPAALRLGLLGEAAFVDEEGSLFLGLRDDAVGLFLGLLDDPLALGVDPLGRPDLLGNRDAKLVDQPERGLLVDDDVVRQGQTLAVGDDRLEALDEEDDVDRRALRGGARADDRSRAARGRIIARPRGDPAAFLALRDRQPVRPSARRSRPRAAAGIISDTSPPKDAISFTSEDET
jgi:hypothetical protein